MKYFAYGSNCNPDVLARKGVTFTERRRARLPAHRLRFNKLALRDALPADVGFANVEEEPGSEVEGVLYELDEAAAERLDETERCPDHYARRPATVVTEDGPVECFLYVARPDKVAEGLRPSRNYLNHILAAHDFLSEQFLAALDSVPVYHGDCYVCGKVGEVLFQREGEHLHMLCQACREARAAWGDVRGRELSAVETRAVMRELVQGGTGFGSLHELVRTAIDTRLIDP